MTSARPTFQRLLLFPLAIAALAVAAPPRIAAAQALVCTSTNVVHSTHGSRFPCATCHSKCGARFACEVPYSFPKGTTTLGGVINRPTSGGTVALTATTSATTCTVGCHYPHGEPTTVAWDAPRPLPCTSCHALATLPATHRPVSAATTRTQCEACHVSSAHLTGDVSVRCGGCHGLPPSSGQHWHAPYGSATCGDCHGWEYDSESAARPQHRNGLTNHAGAIEVWDPTWWTCVNACHGYDHWGYHR